MFDIKLRVDIGKDTRGMRLIQYEATAEFEDYQCVGAGDSVAEALKRLESQIRGLDSLKKMAKAEKAHREGKITWQPFKMGPEGCYMIESVYADLEGRNYTYDRESRFESDLETAKAVAESIVKESPHLSHARVMKIQYIGVFVVE